MKKHSKNPKNERTLLTYVEYQSHADGKSDQTIKIHRQAIRRYERHTKYADFAKFDQRIAISFREALMESDLALPSVHSTMQAVKRFFAWLALQPGYKRSIRPKDIDYLNLTDKQARAATAPSERAYPGLSLIEKVVAQMPSETPVQKRNRALIVFTAITGIRDGATVSLKIKHFDHLEMLVRQKGGEVNTKASKTINTFLFPMNDTFEGIYLDWLEYLQTTLNFGPNDPMFPRTSVTQDENDRFIGNGLTKEHWTTASAMRRIFKEAFVSEGYEPYTPHGFRNMIVAEMYARGLSIEEFKAWSQNIGHTSVQTTVASYGHLSIYDQKRLVRSVKQNSDENLTADKIIEILKQAKST